MRFLFAVALAVPLLVGFDGPRRVGVLVLAHGGSERWNRAVETAVEQAQLVYPTEVVFGMGMHPQEVEPIQRAVDRLQVHGVSRLVVVPLLVSSSSEVMRQFQYLFGLRDHGPWETHVASLALGVSVVMTDPLDDDPVVSEILLERARALSRSPKEETVVLVAHGPTTDEDEVQWLAVMARIAHRLATEGRFRAVVPVTMRDDASAPVREAAIRRMRELVERHSLDGRTLVIPLLLAAGGIEAKIPERLEGLTYAYHGVPLLPHPKLSHWIAHRVEDALERPSAAAVGPALPVAQANRL